MLTDIHAHFEFDLSLTFWILIFIKVLANTQAALLSLIHLFLIGR